MRRSNSSWTSSNSARVTVSRSPEKWGRIAHLLRSLFKSVSVGMVCVLAMILVALSRRPTTPSSLETTVADAIGDASQQAP